jgi:hypothetical protein
LWADLGDEWKLQLFDKVRIDDGLIRKDRAILMSPALFKALPTFQFSASFRSPKARPLRQKQNVNPATAAWTYQENQLIDQTKKNCNLGALRHNNVTKLL